MSNTHNFINGKKFSDYSDYPSKSNCPNYNSIINGASNLESTERRVAGILSNVSLAGESVGDDVYSIDSSSIGSNDAIYNDNQLEFALLAIGDDIAETRNLINNIANQISENLATIAQNNSQISSLNSQIAELKASMPSSDDEDSALERAEIQSQIAELESQIGELESMNASLNADNASLRTSYREYSALEVEKGRVEHTLQGIYKTAQEIAARQTNLFGGNDINYDDDRGSDIYVDENGNEMTYNEALRRGIIDGDEYDMHMRGIVVPQAVRDLIETLGEHNYDFGRMTEEEWQNLQQNLGQTIAGENTPQDVGNAYIEYMDLLLGDYTSGEYSEQDGYQYYTGSNYLLDYTVCMRDGKVYSITTNDNGAPTYTYDADGNLASILYGESNLYADYSNPGEVNFGRYNPQTGETESISIFDDENLPVMQYGASQNDLILNFSTLIDDPYIWENMQKYFPESSFQSTDDAMEFYELYFNRLGEQGCGYAATADSVFDHFSGREEEFEEIFGYPMYSIDYEGNINYNYENFIVDFANYSLSHKYGDANTQDFYDYLSGRNDEIREELFQAWDDYPNSEEYKRLYNSPTNPEWTDEEWDQYWSNRRTAQENLATLFENYDSFEPKVNKGFYLERNENFGDVVSYLENYGIDASVSFNNTPTGSGNVIIAAGDYNWDMITANGASIPSNVTSGHYFYQTNKLADDGNKIESSWGRKYSYDGKNGFEAEIGINFN